MVSRLSGSSISTRTGRFSLRSFVFLFYLFSPLFFSLVLLIFFLGTATRRRFIFFWRAKWNLFKGEKRREIVRGKTKTKKTKQKIRRRWIVFFFFPFFWRFLLCVSAENKMAGPTSNWWTTAPDWSQICCPCIGRKQNGRPHWWLVANLLPLLRICFWCPAGNKAPIFPLVTGLFLGPIRDRRFFVVAFVDLTWKLFAWHPVAITAPKGEPIFGPRLLVGRLVSWPITGRRFVLL